MELYTQKGNRGKDWERGGDKKIIISFGIKIIDRMINRTLSAYSVTDRQRERKTMGKRKRERESVKDRDG